MKLQEKFSEPYAEAFSPGSATLFFIPNKFKDFKRKGSRGVAICLESGMKTRVIPGSNIEVRFNGIPIDNSIQEEVANLLKFNGKIISSSDLPPSSGFGLSAAAALTTAAAILGNNTPIGYIYNLSHEIEIRRGTGLGDVQSQINGGFHVRLRGGSFPYSITERILVAEKEIILLPYKKKIPTGEVINSDGIVETIRKNGSKALKNFLRKPTLENAFIQGRIFATESNLILPRAMSILEDLQNKPATVSLIGESIIAPYDYETFDILRKYGNPIKSKISLNGLTITL